MIDRDFPRAQVQRLAHLNFFPAGSDEGIKELINACMIAETEGLVTQAIDHFVQRERDCPKPIDIRELVHSMNERYRAEHPRPVCPRCDGTRSISKSVLVTEAFEDGRMVRRKRVLARSEVESVRASLDSGQQIYEGSEPCPVCRSQIPQPAV